MTNPNREDLERELDGLVADDVAGGSFKVHRKVYVDREIFELEKERVFNRSWLYVAHESEIPRPGDFRTRIAAGRSLIVARGDDGAIRVLLNHCSHRGTLLCREAAGTAKHFRCPYHAWTYDTSGRLTAVPSPEAYGPEFDKKSWGLKSTPRFENYRGFIFVAFDPTIEPFTESLRDAKEYLDLVCDMSETGLEVLPGSHRYSMRANWKLLVENGVDNYHFAILHNRYIQHLRDNGVDIGPRGEQCDVSVGKSLGNGHGVSEHQQLASFGRLAGHWGTLLPAWTKDTLDALRANLDARVGKERAFRIAQTNRNVRFFPNLYVLDHISPVIRLITPRAVDFIDVQEWVLAPKGESPEIRALRMRNNFLQVGPAGFVSSDDVEVLDLTQRGLEHPEMEWVDSSRGMKLGRHLSSDEQQMRGLHRHWHELMTLGRVRHPEDV